jgi:hypothetical protein
LIAGFTRVQAAIDRPDRIRIGLRLGVAEITQNVMLGLEPGISGCAEIGSN